MPTFLSPLILIYSALISRINSYHIISYDCEGSQVNQIRLSNGNHLFSVNYSNKLCVLIGDPQSILKKPPYKPTGPAGFGPVKGKFRGLQKPIHKSFPAGRKGTLFKGPSSQVISDTLQTPWYQGFRGGLQRPTIIKSQAGLFETQIRGL